MPHIVYIFEANVNSTHSKDDPILEVGEALVTLLTVVVPCSAFCHLLVALRTGAGFVEAVFRLDERDGSLRAEVVWFVSMTKI